MADLEKKRALDDDLRKRLTDGINEFKANFKAEHETAKGDQPATNKEANKPADAKKPSPPPPAKEQAQPAAAKA
jgi:F-type H+/Na+-transporting ATPase subunit alpha